MRGRSWPSEGSPGSGAAVRLSVLLSLAGLNFVAALLAAFVAIQGIANHLRDSGQDTRAATDSKVESAPGSASAGPDIYFIVLDGYARADILANYYGFDNSPFLDGLRARGFQVSDASRSNFYWTFLSVGSSLNLDYVQALLGDALDPGSRDRSELYRLLRDNRAAHFLRERGYRFVQLQSTWGGTSSNPYADEFLPCQTGIFGNEYLRAVADASWLRALESKASLDVANCHLRNFETLAAEAGAPGPKFVFAHFMPPHHPYLFDRDGNVLRKATISDQFEFQKRLWEDRRSYVEQLRYVNRRIADVVDRLIKDSPRPPVILLVSDHGPNLRQGMHPQEERHVRLANLTAMYVPGAPAGFPARRRDTGQPHAPRVQSLLRREPAVSSGPVLHLELSAPARSPGSGPRQPAAAQSPRFLTECDVVGGLPPSLTGEMRRMKHPFEKLACAIAVSLAAIAPAAAYIDPGTGSMLLQVIGAGIAGAIFYFRELRIKLLSLFSRREAPAAEDNSEPPSGDPPR